jgi:hypothetical protein
MAECKHPVWRLLHRPEKKDEDFKGLLRMLLGWGVTGVVSAITFGIQDGLPGVLAGFTIAAVFCSIDFVIYRPQILRKDLAAWSPVAVFFGTLWLAPERTDSVAFYSTVSQFIPVLFLGWILDARALADRLPAFRRAALFTVACLGFAGYQSLVVITANDAEAGSFNLVVAALTATVVGLILVALAPTDTEAPSPKR